jgi:hypothetical protein
LKHLLILLMVISLSHTAIAGPKFQNGDMESPETSWTPTADSTAVWSSDQAHGGVYSYVVSIKDDNNDNAPDGTEGEIKSNKFHTLSPGCNKAYTLSGWFYAKSFDSKNDSAEILIILYRGDNTGISAIKRIVEEDVVLKQWTELKIGPFKDNFCGGEARIGLLMNVGKVEDWNSIPVVYWDDITLKE